MLGVRIRLRIGVGFGSGLGLGIERQCLNTAPETTRVTMIILVVDHRPVFGLRYNTIVCI